jgi:hypothetical protein
MYKTEHYVDFIVFKGSDLSREYCFREIGNSEQSISSKRVTGVTVFLEAIKDPLVYRDSLFFPGNKRLLPCYSFVK